MIGRIVSNAPANMTADKQPATWAIRLYGLGMMALALVFLAERDFDPGQPALNLLLTGAAWVFAASLPR